MKLEEFLSQPVGMPFEVYQDKLNQLHKLEKKCRSLLDKTVWEAEAMELFDDHSDPIYIKHKELHEKYHTQFTKYMNEIQTIKKQLKG